MDDTQVDLMGGSDEASNERSSFVVPTGRPLRNQKSRKACRSCEEDRKAGKAKVLRILRQRIGRKNQITVLLSPTRRRRGRRKGRLDSFCGTYESHAQFGTSLGNKSTSNCLRLCTSIQRALLVNIQMSALLSYHSGTPFPSFAGIFISLYLFFFFTLLRESRDFVRWVGVQTVLTRENVFEDGRIKTNKASTASRGAQGCKMVHPATLSLILVSILKCGGKGHMPEKSLEFANSCSKQTKPVTQYYHIYSIKRRNSKHLSVLHDIYK